MSLLRRSTLTALVIAFALSNIPALAADKNDDKAEKLAAARARLDQAAREVAELSSDMAAEGLPDRLVFLGRNPNRAVLGVGLGEASKAGDGVPVVSVTPGGPAASAGVKPGDVITAINGKPVKREGMPAQRALLDEVAKLSPGDDVSLAITREGKPQAVKFKAERLARGDVPAERMLRYRIDRPDGDFGPNARDIDVMVERAMQSGGAFDDLELVPITPTLGKYFGAERGLLVVRAPEHKASSEPGRLEDGDVLIDIDGRVPNNPRHAFNILRSYQPGEKLTLHVLRERKKMTLATTVPADDRRMRRREIRQFNFPAPPPPPVPPVPPTSPAT